MMMGSFIFCCNLVEVSVPHRNIFEIFGLNRRHIESAVGFHALNFLIDINIESVITDEQVYSNDRSKLWHRPNDMPDSMDIRRYTALYQELYFPIKKNL